MNFLVVNARRSGEALISGDPVAGMLKGLQLLPIHVDHGARLSPLVSPHRYCFLQVFEQAEAHAMNIRLTVESGASSVLAPLRCV